MTDAVSTPFNMGDGPINLIGPNYAPVQGTCGTNPENWTFGGGGNYPRPYTSFSQRVVEASNSLGPFGIRIGGTSNGGDGRIFISSEGLSFREQRWYTQDDGDTGYPTKAEWWAGCIKYVIRAHDVHYDGWPESLIEVAITNPIDDEIFPPPFDPLLLLDGILPPILGLITGIPAIPLGPFIGGPSLPGLPGLPDLPDLPDWLLGGGNPLGDTLNTPDGDFANMISTLGETLGNSFNDFRTWVEGLDEETPVEQDWISNFLSGVTDGETCLNTHIAHNITPPDGNGSFDGVPGELKTNPRLCVLSNRGMQNLASILGTGGLLPTNTGGENGVDAAARSSMGDNFSDFINLGTANFAMGSQGRGLGGWLIFGTTIFNEASFPESNSAALNPCIDSDGNLHLYDTYDFGTSNASGLIDSARGIIGDSAANSIEAFLDTSPGFHKSGALSASGKTRQQNSGGTPNNIPLSGVNQNQNTYIDVVITPSNLQRGNPELYNALRNGGYFDHVDPSKLP